MSSRLAVPSLRRRSLLQLLLSTGLGPGLTGCGGGSTDEQQGKSASMLKTLADDAVASGLVGLVLGWVTSTLTTVTVAGKRRLGRDALGPAGNWACTGAAYAKWLHWHTGHVAGFMAEAALDRGGDFALFGLSNTGHMAEDGSSWVLRRIDQALTEVLRQRSISL